MRKNLKKILVVWLFLLLLFSCKPQRKEYSKTWLVLGTVCRVRVLTTEHKKKS